MYMSASITVYESRKGDKPNWNGEINSRIRSLQLHTKPTTHAEERNNEGKEEDLEKFPSWALEIIDNTLMLITVCMQKLS